MENQIDANIIKKAQLGDLAAFETILFAYEKAIFNHLYRLVGHRQDAEDLTQDTFVKAYKKLNQVKPEENFRAWLYKVATNTAYDWFRKKKRANEILVDPSETQVFEAAETETVNDMAIENDRHDIARAMDKIKPAYKAVLMMYYYSDLSYQEISNALSVPINTVKTQLHRAKQALKKNLLYEPPQ